MTVAMQVKFVEWRNPDIRCVRDDRASFKQKRSFTNAHIELDFRHVALKKKCRIVAFVRPWPYLARHLTKDNFRRFRCAKISSPEQVSSTMVNHRN